MQRRSKATDEAHCTCCCVTGKVFVVLQDRVHECVVNHTRFGQWYVSNNQLALFRSDIHRPSQVVQDEVIADADQIPASGELAEILEIGDDNLTLNTMPFCEGSVSYSERLVEARKIASPWPRNDKEVDEALASAKKRFFATYANKVGEQYDEEIGRSNCRGRHMRWNAYISKVFGKTRKLVDYLRTGAMLEASSYPRLFCFLCLRCQTLLVLRNSAYCATTQQGNR